MESTSHFDFLYFFLSLFIFHLDSVLLRLRNLTLHLHAPHFPVLVLLLLLLFVLSFPFHLWKNRFPRFLGRPLPLHIQLGLDFHLSASGYSFLVISQSFRVPCLVLPLGNHHSVVSHSFCLSFVAFHSGDCLSFAGNPFPSSAFSSAFLLIFWQILICISGASVGWGVDMGLEFGGCYPQALLFIIKK